MRSVAWVALLLGWLIFGPSGVAAEQIQIAYAGSMGVIMDRYLGPRFAAGHSVEYQGIGHGSYGLARLISSGQLRPDVFVSVTRGPMEVLIRAGLIRSAEPFASTEMVVIFNPKSRFASDLKRAAAGGLPWYRVLEKPGLRFGRTDPAVDPQGRNVIFTMLLAERYYHRPDLETGILGGAENPNQLFAEPSLLSRLEAGQLDATMGYRSAAVSHGQPYISLPPEINLGDAEYAEEWYSKVEFTIRGPEGAAEILHTQPLVFYAGVTANARHPELGRAFVSYLLSKRAQAALKRQGYSGPSGSILQ